MDIHCHDCSPKQPCRSSSHPPSGLPMVLAIATADWKSDDTTAPAHREPVRDVGDRAGKEPASATPSTNRSGEKPAGSVTSAMGDSAMGDVDANRDIDSSVDIRSVLPSSGRGAKEDPPWVP